MQPPLDRRVITIYIFFFCFPLNAWGDMASISHANFSTNKNPYVTSNKLFHKKKSDFINFSIFIIFMILLLYFIII